MCPENFQFPQFPISLIPLILQKNSSMVAFKEIEVSKNEPLAELPFLGRMILDGFFTKEKFKQLAARYPDLQMEREKDGKITIMSPVKSGSGKRESIVIGYLFAWWLKSQEGQTFSSSVGIELNDTSIKSPDCAWVSAERYAQVSAEEEEGEFLQVAPDFVVEVRSFSDRIAKLKKKMTDSWLKNGVRLAWLIDPYSETAYIYRENGKHETIEGFEGKTLTGETVMPGMELPLDMMRVRKK